MIPDFIKNKLVYKTNDQFLQFPLNQLKSVNGILRMENDRIVFRSVLFLNCYPDLKHFEKDVEEYRWMARRRIAESILLNIDSIPTVLRCDERVEYNNFDRLEYTMTAYLGKVETMQVRIAEVTNPIIQFVENKNSIRYILSTCIDQVSKIINQRVKNLYDTFIHK